MYDIAIHNATLYGPALGLRHSHKFTGLISECGRSLNGLDCLLWTPEKSAGVTMIPTVRRSVNFKESGKVRENRQSEGKLEKYQSATSSSAMAETA